MTRSETNAATAVIYVHVTLRVLLSPDICRNSIAVHQRYASVWLLSLRPNAVHRWVPRDASRGEEPYDVEAV